MNKKINRRKPTARKQAFEDVVSRARSFAADALEVTQVIILPTLSSLLKRMVTAVAKAHADRQNRLVLTKVHAKKQPRLARTTEPDTWYNTAEPSSLLTKVFVIVILLHVIAIAGILAWKFADVASPVLTADISVAVEKAIEPAPSAPAEVEVSKPEVKVFYDLETVNEIPLAEVLAMFSDSRFFKPGSIANVRPEVLRAWTILYEEMIRHGVHTRFTPHQLATIAWMESGQGDRKNPYTAMIATRLIGDKKLYHKAYGALQLRKPAWEEVIVDKDGRMPFAPELMSELRGLGITNEDFLGNLPFSVLVLEWWHYRYSPKSSDYADLTGRYNVGPGLFPNAKSRRYSGWCVSRLDSVLAMTPAPLPTIEREMLTQTETTSVKGTVAEDEQEVLEQKPVLAARQSWMEQFVGTMKTVWSFASVWFSREDSIAQTTQAASISLDFPKSIKAPTHNEVDTTGVSKLPEVLHHPLYGWYDPREKQDSDIIAPASGGDLDLSGSLFPVSLVKAADIATRDAGSNDLVFLGPAL